MYADYIPYCIYQPTTFSAIFPHIHIFLYNSLSLIKNIFVALGLELPSVA